MSLHRERGAMVVDDLRALPDSPLVVAEGSPLPAWAVPDRSRALWLLPSAELQRARLRVPAGVLSLYLRLGEEIRREAAEHGVPVLEVDGSPDVGGAVERSLGDALAAGPAAGTLAAAARAAARAQRGGRGAGARLPRAAVGDRRPRGGGVRVRVRVRRSRVRGGAAAPPARPVSRTAACPRAIGRAAGPSTRKHATTAVASMAAVTNAPPAVACSPRSRTNAATAARQVVTSSRRPASSGGTGRRNSRATSSSGGRTAGPPASSSRRASAPARSTATSATQTSAGPASSSGAEPRPGTAAPAANIVTPAATSAQPLRRASSTSPRPEAEAELLAALEEIGDGDGFDFDALDLTLDEPVLEAEADAAEPPADDTE